MNMDEAVYDKIRGGYRVFIGDLGNRIGKYELEREFKDFGPITDTWVARNPPGFAFLVFKYAEDAERAVRKVHGRRIDGRRIRVEHARPFEERRRLQMEAISQEKQRFSRSRSPIRPRLRSRDRRRSRSQDGPSRYTDRNRSRSHSSSRKSKISSNSKTQSRSKSPQKRKRRSSEAHSTSQDDHDSRRIKSPSNQDGVKSPGSQKSKRHSAEDVTVIAFRSTSPQKSKRHSAEIPNKSCDNDKKSWSPSIRDNERVRADSPVPMENNIYSEKGSDTE